MDMVVHACEPRGRYSAHGLLASESLSLDLLSNPTITRTYVDRDARTVTQVTDTPDSTLDVAKPCGECRKAFLSLAPAP